MMLRQSAILAILASLAVTTAVWAAPVTFNDSNLEAAVRAQWEAATSETLSTPPEDTELADSRFTELTASYDAISDLTGLEACTSLTKLDVSNNAITDVTPIAGLTGLTYLDIGFGNLFDKKKGGDLPTNANQISDISSLSGLVNLEYLNIGGNAALDDISILSGMDNLSMLWIGFNNVTDFSPLSDVADSLQFFIAVFTGMAQSDLAYVAGMTNLVALGILGEDNVTDFSPLSVLNLNIFLSMQMSVSDISFLSGQSNLNTLQIEGLELTNLNALAGLTNLNDVGISGCPLTDISGLDGLTSIERLEINKNQITDISALASLTSLHEIDLSDNQITDIQALVDNSGLGGDDYVDIQNNPFSEEAACNQLPALRAKFNNAGNVNSNAICGPVVTLTINVAGTGSTSPDPGTVQYAQGSIAYVNSRPESNSGWAFDHWEGDIPSGVDPTNGNLQLTMNANKTVTAVYVTPGDYTLTLISAGPGASNAWLSPDPGVISFKANRQVYLNWGSNDNAYFAGWSGDVTGYASNVSLIMDSDKTVTATFAGNGYYLHLNCNGQGGIDGFNTDQDILFAAGASFDLRAFGWSGYQFDHWQGDIPSGADASVNPLSVVMDQNRNITASFTQNPPQVLTIIIDGTGATNPAGAAAPGLTYQYPQFQQAYIEAYRGQDGWAFSHWSGDIGGNSATSTRLNITMDMSKTVTAHYVAADYNLTVAYTGNGSTWPEPGTYGYLSGSEAEFGANLVSGGDAFDQWTGDLPEGRDPQETHHHIIMDQDRSVTAAFVPGNWTLTINGIAGGGAGYQDPQPGTYGYLEGRMARAEIRLNDGMFWGGWTGTISSLDYLLTFPITSNATVTPNVAATGYTLTLASSDISLGTTDPEGTVGYMAGISPTVTAVEQDSGFFTHWTGDLPAGVDANSAEIQVLMDQNRSLTANFAEHDWYLYLQIQGNGVTDPAVGVHWYNEGDSVIITATPAEGNVFYMWDGLLEGEGDINAAETTVVMHADRVLTAIFVPSAITVPDLAGMTQQGAENALLAAGLALGDVTQDYSETVPEGQVMGQTPDAGTGVSYGSSVNVVVSLGPPTGEGDGEGDGEGFILGPHSADQDANHIISLTELLRVIQFFNIGGFHCVTAPATSEDGYLPGLDGDHTCAPHSSDYNPQNWQISLTELLRLIQFFNIGGYHECPGTGTEDDYCIGLS